MIDDVRAPPPAFTRRRLAAAAAFAAPSALLLGCGRAPPAPAPAGSAQAALEALVARGTGGIVWFALTGPVAAADASGRVFAQVTAARALRLAPAGADRALAIFDVWRAGDATRLTGASVTTALPRIEVAGPTVFADREARLGVADDARGLAAVETLTLGPDACRVLALFDGSRAPALGLAPGLAAARLEGRIGPAPALDAATARAFDAWRAAG